MVPKGNLGFLAKRNGIALEQKEKMPLISSAWREEGEIGASVDNLKNAG